MSAPAVLGADAANVEGIQKKVAEAKKEVAEAKKEVAEAKKEVAEAEKKVEKAEKKVEKAKAEVEKAKAEVKAAQNKMKEEQDVATTMLTIALDGLKTALKDLDTSVEERKSQVRRLNDVLNELRHAELQAHQALGATPTGAAGGAQAASGQDELLAAVEKLAVDLAKIAKQEREEELLSRMVQVHFRLWDGGKVVKSYASPSTLYQTARNAFPNCFAPEVPLSLYLLPDVEDISSRIKLDSEHPFLKARMILSSSPCLILLYLRPQNDQSPARLPAPFDTKREGGDLDGSESSGSRGQQQSEFRAEVMKASKWRDFLTGAEIQQRAGDCGQAGEACHIVPVRQGDFGTLEQRRDLLKRHGQQPNLYIPANGIPLLKDFHGYFDGLNLSIDVDKGYTIKVWNVPGTARNVRRLDGQVASLKKCSWIASKALLRWHHGLCVQKHASG